MAPFAFQGGLMIIDAVISLFSGGLPGSGLADRTAITS
jgi:TRAP-type C4-dicarboxylate transport system permease large subunit